MFAESPGRPAGQRDDLGVDDGHEIRQRGAQIVGGACDRLGDGIIGFVAVRDGGQRDDEVVLHVEIHQRVRGIDLAQCLLDAGRTDVGLDTPVAAAATAPAVEHQQGVAPLAGRIRRTAEDPPAEHDPGADAGAEVDGGQARAVAPTAEPQFRDRDRLERVLDHEWQVEPFAQMLELDRLPGPVRHDDRNTLRTLDETGQRDADAEDGVAGDAGLIEQAVQGATDALDDGVRVQHVFVARALHREDLVERRVEHHGADVGLGDVDAHDHPARLVHAERGRRPADPPRRHLALLDDALGQQLADHRDNGGGAESGELGEFVAGRLARGEHRVEHVQP